MADFATEFITKLNGKLTPEQMKVVLNELEIFSDDYNIEKKCRDVAVPDDLLPACYKVYMVSKKIEGMSPQSLITYKCYLEQFLYAVGKPVEKITANDIRLYLYGLVGKNSDHTHDDLRKSNAGKRKIQPSPIRSLTSLQRAVRKRVQCS